MLMSPAMIPYVYGKAFQYDDSLNRLVNLLKQITRSLVRSQQLKQLPTGCLSTYNDDRRTMSDRSPMCCSSKTLSLQRFLI